MSISEPSKSASHARPDPLEERRAAGISSVMSETQWKLLEFFARRRAATVGEALRELDLGKTNAHHHADMLTERGLLAEIGLPGRAKPREITELGRLVLTMRKRSEGEPLNMEERSLYENYRLLHDYIVRVTGITDPEQIGRMMRSSQFRQWADGLKSLAREVTGEPQIPDTVRKGGKDAPDERRQSQQKRSQEKGNTRATGTRAS